MTPHSENGHARAARPARGGTGGTRALVAGDPPDFSVDRIGADVARYLRNAIVSGAFSAGERLSPGALADQLGLSTMPVREALVALTSEGLVDSLPRRGFRVAHIKARDVSDAFRVHAFIAGLLAAEAATTAPPELIEELRRVQQEIVELDASGPERPDRTDRIEELNFAFHRLVNNATDAPRLQWFMRAAARFIPQHFYDDVPGSRDSTLEDHPAIIDALARYDADAARRLMEAHILRGGDLVVQQLARRGFFDQLAPDTGDDIAAPTSPSHR